MRITADCPLLDPQIVDKILEKVINHPELDYVSNTLKRSYPRGMDVEVFSFKALSNAAKNAKADFEREHVTPYLYQHPDQFLCSNVEFDRDESGYRLTVDTPEDLKLITTVIEEIYPNKPEFTLEDILEAFKRNPEWIKINAHIHQKKLGE